jgi:TPR repeat protein
MGAPVDVPENHPSASAKAHAARPAGSVSASAGAFELERAEHAGDAEARAAWLWNAVSKGNSQASVELAKMYVQGSGVIRNCDQAQILLRIAAEKGNEQAKLNLQQIRRQGGCGAQ